VIDFRYHLVSIIAVFLAIALGIVIGTTQLNGTILDDLRGQVTALEGDKRQLEDTAQQLKTRVDSGDAFEQAVAPTLVAGRLTGRSVLLVVADGTVPSGAVDDLGRLVVQAGGRVAGTVRLQPAYTDPASVPALASYLAGPGLPPGVVLPPTADTGRRVGSLLGQVLMVRPGAPAGDARAAEISSVLAGLSSLDVLTAESDSVTAADYAVVVTAKPPVTPDAADRTATLVELAAALDAAGSGAVVAGTVDSTAKGGLVAAVRADPVTSTAVSTVDNVDAVGGRISTVLALGQEAAGTTGKYGSGPGTQPVPPVSR
jgi:hypothetical protein